LARAARLLLLLALAGGLPPGARAGDEPSSRVEALSSRIICNCDCGNKIVSTCYCGVADSFRQEIAARIAAGDSDDQVLAYFVDKYGERILSAPTPQGFNLAAWAAPAVFLAGGLLLAAFLLRRWSRRGRLAPDVPPPASPAADPYEKAFEAEMASRRD